MASYLFNQPAALGESAFLSQITRKWCSRDPRQASISSPWTYQSTPVSAHASQLGTLPPLSVFFRGRRQPPHSPGHRRPRPGGSPLHHFHLVNILQRRPLFMVRWPNLIGSYLFGIESKDLVPSLLTRRRLYDAWTVDVPSKLL